MVKKITTPRPKGGDNCNNTREVYVEYQINKWKATLISLILRVTFLTIGISLTVFLVRSCLFNVECNTVVTIFLAVLALSCFQAAGFPIDKLANFKFT